MGGWSKKWTHFRCQIPDPKLGPDSGPLWYSLYCCQAAVPILGPDSGTQNGSVVDPDFAKNRHMQYGNGTTVARDELPKGKHHCG